MTKLYTPCYLCTDVVREGSMCLNHPALVYKHPAYLVNPRRACAARVTVVGSVCLLSHISPMERLFVLKTLSRTQRATKVKIFVGFSLKPLRCRDPALPPLCGRAYSRPFFLLKARMRIIVFTTWRTEAVLYGGAEKTVVSFVSYH